MAFETIPFGDGVSTTRVSTVHTHFGPMVELGPEGVIKTEGNHNEVSWEITGKEINLSTRAARFLVPPTLPAGAVISEVIVKVKEAFALSGTSPTIVFGTDTTEATNGFVISKAQAEALGTYKVTSTLTGTWASPLAATTAVDVALGGTTPTATNAGRLEVVLTYSVV